MFGATSTSPFGAPQQPNPFGASSAPAFGQSSTAGGGLFGARPFGATSPSPFGAQQPQAGGLFGAGTSTGALGATQPAFGGSAGFGQTSSTPTFGGTATFGAPQQPNPFGGASFGTSQPAFGTTAFGAASAPAFGASSTPAFGASSAPAFGTSTFGASAPAFGTSAFGAASTPAFGTFGQTASTFGASSGGAFGAATTPAFGAGTSPFGQSSSAFGSVTTTPAFGAGGFGGGGAFGAAQKGTRWKRFEATPEADGTAGVQGKFQTITAMKEYQGKSVEELRMEDYANNDKGGPPPAGAAGGLFGQPQAAPFGSPPAASPFGTSSPSPFGAGSSSNIFGGATQGASPFGQAASTPAFGGASAPAFGGSAFGAPTQQSPFGAPAAQTPAFGAPATGSAFGGASSTPAFGGAFGAPSQSAFGTTTFGSTPAFGQSQAAAGSSIFGQSTGTFGQSSSAFGASNAFGASAPAFGSAFAGSAFGAPTTSAFGAPSSSSLFGPQTSGSIFGGQSTSAFGFGGAQTKPAGLQLSTPSSTGGLFGPTPQQAGSAPSFGGGFGGGNLFGTAATQPAQISLFGTGGAFGAPQAAASPFSFATQPAGAPAFSFSPQPQQQTFGGVQPTMQPAPVTSPFGTLPAMPQISITRTGGSSPAVQYGISTLPLSDRAPPAVRTTSMLTPRHITPRSRIRLQARKVVPKVSPGGKSGLFGDSLEQSPNPRADVLFAPRLDNPRVLFIREQTVEYSLSPGSANGGTPVRQLTGNGETPQKQLSANGETPAKQSGAGSPATLGGPSTPGGPSGTAMSEGGETPAEQTPQRNGETPVSAKARDKGKRPMREEGEGQQNGATNGRYEPGPDVEALVPKLHQPDYYTEPKLQELAAKERAERGYMKRVPNFTVGRRGFGSVRFFGETDVRGLDLQSIIIFNDKEVIVYPDEDQKPDVGSGLNKPAEVTVLNVKRYDKKTGEAITQGPMLDKFERILKDKTVEQGATFISWDREKGEWKFRVEHFSRYGLDLDEEDDMELASAQENPQADNAPAEGEGSELTFGNAQGLRGSEQEEVFSRGGVALAHSLPSQLGLDPLRMHQMRATLFAEDESEAARRERQRFFRTPAAKVHFPIPGFSPLVTPERATAQEEEEPAETLEASGRPLAVWQRKRPLSGGMTGSVPARRAPMLPITGPDVVPAKRARVTVGFFEEAPAVTAADSKAGVDAGLFLGRSFRVGWGPNGVLLHAGGGSAGEDKSEGQKKVLSSQVRIEEVALNTTPDPVDWFVNPLQVHRQHAVQEEGGNGAKRLAMQCSREELALLCGFYSEIARSQAEQGNGDVSSMVVALQEQAVWRLVDVLFSKKGGAGAGANGSAQSGDEEMEQEGAGPPPAQGFEGLDAGLLEDEDVQEMERRARLSEWIRENAVNGAERDLEEITAAADKKGKRPEGAEAGSAMKEVLAYLTARNLEDAVGVAVASGDVRLATLIAQSGGSLEERADVARQVAAWEALHVDEHVDKDRLRVYKLLAGDVDGALEGALPVDWKRYLGLLLWHGLPPQASIPELLAAYKTAWTREGASVPAPIPLYVEEGARLELPKPKTQAAIDTSYYLMLLYGSPSVDLASMQKMLRSASSTFDWLDHRLAWHLYSVLNAIGIPLPNSAEELHMNYVAQLAAAGLCEWAIYVALHIEDERLREQSVKELLERHCEEWSEDEEKVAFLSEGLNIPQEWMHAAQAQLSQASGNEEAALEHLIASRQPGPAHQLLMTAVAPKLFVEGAHEVLIAQAEALAVSAADIAEWQQGGQLYLDFYRVREALKAEAEEREADLVGLEQRTAACKSLFTRIAKARMLWEGGSADRHLRLVYARMADDLSRLLLIDTEKSAPTESLAAAAFTTLLNTPVPQDVRSCRIHDAVAHFTQWLAEPIA